MWQLLFLGLLASGCEAKGRLRLFDPPVPHGYTLPPDMWFDQKLDHFDPTNTRTWKQRYFVNDTFFKVASNSPVFLQIGGEGEASANWMVTGAWIDYAQKYGALCFQLEHRFYGKSRPTPDMSVENLEYLSSEQALADLAYFITGMNIKYKLSLGNHWIAFGGSYPGSLAAWLRLKYPHLLHAAVSSSGPLLAVDDFKQYNEVVRDALRTTNSYCASAVKQATMSLDKHFEKSKDSQLTELFKLCTPLDSKNEKDVANLGEILADNFAGVVQYNKDNRISQSPTGKVTIETLCDIMTDVSKGTPLQRYAAVNSYMMSLQNQTCLDYEYKNSIAVLKNESWDSISSEGGRQWTYQTCTEFGFYQTSSTQGELFGKSFPLKFFTDQCQDIYGPRYDRTLLRNGIERTNNMYGELNIRVSRVVFVHGSIDPWHALGITQTVFRTSPAIYIQGTAHCANMYPSSPNDPPSLVTARRHIEYLIGKWLMESDYITP